MELGDALILASELKQATCLLRCPTGTSWAEAASHQPPHALIAGQFDVFGTIGGQVANVAITLLVQPPARTTFGHLRASCGYVPAVQFTERRQL